ncbi:SIMPL domain-containing protein [bacterium]|nr:SIMPL domain-containing protein [bacterium]
MLEKVEKFQVLLLGIIIAIGGIVMTSIVSSAMSKDVISVTGSYSQNVTSDSGALEFELKANGVNKAAAYNTLNKQRPDVIKYLHAQGFSDKDIEIKTPRGYDVYELTYNGNSTNKVIGFNASQTIVLQSDDVQKIKKVSTGITNLTAQGIDVNVYEPSYFYSKLSDLKVKMLEEATKDAKQRASAMLKATHNRVGKIQSVKMGVFQITPVNSTNVSDMGINDTTTIEKKITSVANVTFGIK